jgi:hypothetical protein
MLDIPLIPLRSAEQNGRAMSMLGIVAYGLNVANYMGGGVLAYFGYPRAHENTKTTAERAVLA